MEDRILDGLLVFGSHSCVRREPQRCTGPYHGPSWKKLEGSVCLCGHANSGRRVPLRDLTLRPGVQGSSQ